MLWAAALVLPVFAGQAGVSFTSLHSFQVPTNGANPYAGLVQGRDGNFYGTTYGGGTNNAGTVFKISTNGLLTPLCFFTGGNDGANPMAGLVQGRDGNLYGTTGGGGTNDTGTVFKISTNGALSSLYSFTGGDDGATPYAGLVQGSDGGLYGTTSEGGTNGNGTVFSITTNGTLTTLYAFGTVTDANGDLLDGANPYAGLVQGSDGNLYGTTENGGTNGWGTVFNISTNGTLTTLYAFGMVTDAYGNPVDGANPISGLAQGKDGDFYGTTEYGGNTNGYGTVFKISTNGTLTTLYTFGTLVDAYGNPLDGANPSAGLVQASDGYLYGTIGYGGTDGSGAVFKISTNGALTTLYSFTGGEDGADPYAGLVQGTDGYFYGTTEYGGANNWGAVFKINTNGVLTSLYSFPAANDGANPSAGLVQGRDGNLYGTTEYSGPRGYGTVFKITTQGALTSLCAFGYPDGGAPEGGLVQGRDGYFYGTTEYSGTYNWGTVFRVSLNGELTSLYSFMGTNDGAYPHAGLVQGNDGNLYGTTPSDIVSIEGLPTIVGAGGVFKISTNGVLLNLHSFTGGSDGGFPEAGLAQGRDGNLYGTTGGGGTGDNGTVFKISTNGVLTSLYSFSGGNDGRFPYAALVQSSDANLYGTTFDGGTNGYGTVFKISTNGAFTSLYSFTGGNDGANPSAALAQVSDGDLYGTTYAGGTNNWGTVFKISTNGALTSLYSFRGGNDGGLPEAGLVQASDDNLYGTTYHGGQGEAGTVFRLTLVIEVGPPAPAFQGETLANRSLSLTWSTEAGEKYQLQYNTNLGSTNWSNLGGPVMAVGAALSATDSITNGPRRFYRVVLVP